MMLWMLSRYFLALLCILCFFFFQAEDGIRDVAVTGVQTCALPISFAPSTATYASPRGGRMPLPSMISMKWFISPSIDPYAVSFGGRTTRLSGALIRDRKSVV